MESRWPSELLENGPLQIHDGDRGKNYPKRQEFTTKGHCVFLNTGNVTQRGHHNEMQEYTFEVL